MLSLCIYIVVIVDISFTVFSTRTFLLAYLHGFEFTMKSVLDVST